MQTPKHYTHMCLLSIWNNSNTMNISRELILPYNSFLTLDGATWLWGFASIQTKVRSGTDVGRMDGGWLAVVIPVQPKGLQWTLWTTSIFPCWSHHGCVLYAPLSKRWSWNDDTLSSRGKRYTILGYENETKWYFKTVFKKPSVTKYITGKRVFYPT